VKKGGAEEGGSAEGCPGRRVVEEEPQGYAGRARESDEQTFGEYSRASHILFSFPVAGVPPGTTGFPLKAGEYRFEEGVLDQLHDSLNDSHLRIVEGA
jgi:hypothetical protein